LARLNPRLDQLPVELSVVRGTGQDAGTVPAPGDVLAGVLPQLLGRELALVLLEVGVGPGVLGEIGVHRRSPVACSGRTKTVLPQCNRPGDGAKRRSEPSAIQPRNRS